MDNYTIIKRIGEGAHGYVLHGRCKQTNKEVALKKVLVKRRERGISNEIIREIKTLQVVDNKYVMKLLNFFPQGAGFILVFDFMPTGLWEMLNDTDLNLTNDHIKSYIKMLLQGISHLHENRIMHRDLKPANLLIGQDGILRIADFGQARPFSKESGRLYTPQVATRWYRAPELLYGSRKYTEAMDLWAAGCIIAEAFTKIPLFPSWNGLTLRLDRVWGAQFRQRPNGLESFGLFVGGGLKETQWPKAIAQLVGKSFSGMDYETNKGETDIDQLATVIRCLGSPTEESWPGHSKLPDYNKIIFKHTPSMAWEKLLPHASKETREFVKSFIKYDAGKRISAKQALKHQFFTTEPLPTPEDCMPIPSADHRNLVHNTIYDKHDEELFEELNLMLDEKY